MSKNRFLYLKLYETLKDQIENGILSPGSKLPGDDELRTQFGVSAITIKKGLSMLAEEGLVRRIPGRGTFVRKEEVIPTAPRRTIGLPTIGMVLEHVSTPFGLEMLYEIDRRLYERGYKLCTRYSYGDRDRETEEINFLVSLGVAGLIIMPCHGNFYNPTLLRLILDNFPIVLIDKKLDGIPVPSVRTNNEKAIGKLVRHLYERGARHIGLVSVELAGTTSLAERAKGFHGEIERLGLPECPQCYVHMSGDIASNEPDTGMINEIADYLEAYKGEIDSIICTEYGILACLIRAANNKNIVLGQDGLRVCCVDEDYLAPGGYTFTHVRQDELAIASCAVKLLIQRIDDTSTLAEDIEIDALFRVGKTS